MESIKYFQLLHLADSALEMLAATGDLTVDGLSEFLKYQHDLSDMIRSTLN